jgi:hypothetical protein
MTNIKYYAPRDITSPIFIIKFDDVGVSDEQFDNEEIAIQRYEQLSVNWNCCLFELKQR